MDFIKHIAIYSDLFGPTEARKLKEAYEQQRHSDDPITFEMFLNSQKSQNEETLSFNPKLNPSIATGLS